MTIKQWKIELNELKLRLRVELLSGNGKRLIECCAGLYILKRSGISKGVWFEEEEVLLNNLESFLTKNRDVNLKSLCRTKEERQKLVSMIFGEERVNEGENGL